MEVNNVPEIFPNIFLCSSLNLFWTKMETNCSTWNVVINRSAARHSARYQLRETNPVMDRHALIFVRGKRAEFHLVSKWPLSEYNTRPAVKRASVGV